LSLPPLYSSCQLKYTHIQLAAAFHFRDDITNASCISQSGQPGPSKSAKHLPLLFSLKQLLAFRFSVYRNCMLKSEFQVDDVQHDRDRQAQIVSLFDRQLVFEINSISILYEDQSATALNCFHMIFDVFVYFGENCGDWERCPAFATETKSSTTRSSAASLTAQ